MTLIRNSLILGSVAFVLSACGLSKDDFGLGRKNPDEFAVVKRAPLEIPESYYLPTPTPGAARPQEVAPEEAAKVAVLGDKANQSVSDSSAIEKILIKKTGADQAEANIRTRVDRETQEYIETNIPVTEKLLNTVGANRQAPALVVDAKAEAQRIRENIEAGRSVTEGEVPTLED